MTSPAHRDLQTALERLAEHEGGRRLLQLSLRGIEAEGAQLGAGCWARRGDAGCLFQHAYWQGVREGTFDDDGDARAWVSRVAGQDGWPRVIDAIDAFDTLARTHYRTGPRSRIPGRGPSLDVEAWRATVLDLLLATLAEPGEETRTARRGMIQLAKL